MTASLEKAKEVARRCLEANCRVLHAPHHSIRVVVAGANQYQSVWTRDFCFAAPGLLEAGLGDAVQDTLYEIIHGQRPDGLMPRLLDSTNQMLRFVNSIVGIRQPLRFPLKPNFISDHLVLAFDSNSLVAWTTARYALKSGKLEWARELLPKLEAGLAFYGKHEKDGFVRQPPFSDWKDTVAARRGAVFFCELLRWLALRGLAELHERLGQRARGADWASKASAHGERLRAAFWDEEAGHFRDTLESPGFSADGNFGAIAWGFATPQEGERIVEACYRLDLWTPWGPRAGQPYPDSEKGYLARLALLHGYQDEFVWLWNSALAILAFERLGKARRLQTLLDTLSERIARDGYVSEVYRPQDGAEVRTWLYRSEAPFTWSSGMLLEAFSAVSKGSAARAA